MTDAIEKVQKSLVRQYSPIEGLKKQGVSNPVDSFGLQVVGLTG